MGGPDAYGYIWKDSNEPDGPVFSWIDITATGTLISGLGDDNVVGPFVMQSDMPFYWYQRKFLWIGSNGYIAFGGGNIASPFPAIPTGGGVNDYIAAMACDLNFLGAGNPAQCFYQDEPNRTIISWVNVPFWSPTAPTYTGSNTFQLIMNKLDSSITVQVLEQNGLTQNNDLSLGIESVAGTIGLQHSYGAYPVAGYAIRYYFPSITSLEVLDAVPAWSTTPGSGGEFLSRNGAPFGMVANALNTGNTNLSNFTMQAQVLNAANVVQLNGTATIPTLLTGLDTTVVYAGGWTPTAVGTYRMVTTISGIAGELVTANNQLTQELVVVDTTAATQSLNYHGSVDNLIGLGWNGGNGGVAVYIQPPYYPAYATATTVRIVSNVGAGYTMKVYDDDGPNGQPGTLLDSVYISPAQATTGDQVIPLSSPLSITSGGVYVQWYMLGANINIAVDANPPFSLRTYEVLDGVWAEYRDRTNQDFFLGLRLAQVPVFDVGCTGFFGLTDGQDVGGQTAVRAWVTNFGNQPASGFTVNYRFGTGAVVSQAYTGAALTPGQQSLFTFNQYFVPTADTNDGLCAWTSLTDDAQALNDTACVAIHTYVGIAELSAAGVSLAPNPADDLLRIEGLGAGRWLLTVVDATGRALRREAFNAPGTFSMAVDGLAPGAYRLVAERDGERYGASFMVRR